MKKTIILLIAAFLAISCSMQVSDKTGSLTLSGARGALTDINGNPATVRYALTRNGKTIPLNNQPLLDVVGSDTATIDSLIPGDGYRLAVSVGHRDGSNFVVESYGYSETFAIAEGTNAAVNVALQIAPDFTWLTSTGGKSSAAVVGTTVNILDSTVLRTFAVDGPLPDINGEPSDFLTGLPAINSLSKGKYFPDGIGDELWLNTSTGIYNNSDGWMSNMQPGMSPNVKFSRAVDIGGSIIAMYSGGGSNIGFIHADNYTDFTSAPGDGITPWQTAADYPAIADFLPEITQDVIKSIAVNDAGFFYVATPLGTAIGSSATTTIEGLLDLDSENWLNIPGLTGAINVVSTVGNRVYAGTNSGLYTSTVDPGTGIPDGLGFTLVQGTAGKKIVALESFSMAQIITAAVTHDNSVLLVQDDFLQETLPGATGIPLNAKPVFYDNGGDLHLILSGTNGSIDYFTSLPTGGT